jgi:hypothetical protein
MDTSDKVVALIRFYSKRYMLSPTDWLEALIELESTPVPKGVEPTIWNRYKQGPRCCEHCGKRTQFGMGAIRHHTNKHAACTMVHPWKDISDCADAGMPERRVDRV